ncbi:MAG: 16S rRNA (adenine(1518)-N(6)/adenine(1519)-N(6))-dimethyltransferase RsmA [Gammaproteobacteria bacterium]|nr:16S rRNA (adenine(1518)-N(6)/adenine(1519)-N(6))-dimethyltransferase RsmA [Gammaproteobacteria bacterium]
MNKTFSHKARKRFGQNFLKDEYIIQKIVAAVNPEKTQNIIEIGPGQGAITRQLLELCQHLDVIEIDRDLVKHLKTIFPDSEKITIHNVDALKFEFCQLASEQKIRLVGNLPYNISTPLLFHILENAYCIEDMHFMLQKEVVNRMASPPGSKAYGRLSVMIQYHCEVQSLFDVNPESFDPPPKVNSSIVQLKPHNTKPVRVKNYASFSHLVTQAFSFRRKTLRNALKNLLTEDQIKSCDVDPKLRPELIDVKSFARLSDLASEQE